MVKVNNFTLEDIQAICESLNKGHEVHIKMEKGGQSIAIVEEHRKLRKKISVE